MYPSLLLLHRRLAKSFLEYRFNRMPAAERKAREHGLEGSTSRAIPEVRSQPAISFLLIPSDVPMGVGVYRSRGTSAARGSDCYGRTCTLLWTQ